MRGSCGPHFGFDLPGGFIDGQVQLPPRATFAVAVFSHLPLPFTVYFQPRAIQDQMDRTFLTDAQLDFQRFGPAVSWSCNREWAISPAAIHSENRQSLRFDDRPADETPP